MELFKLLFVLFVIRFWNLRPVREEGVGRHIASSGANILKQHEIGLL